MFTKTVINQFCENTASVMFIANDNIYIAAPPTCNGGHDRHFTIIYFIEETYGGFVKFVRGPTQCTCADTDMHVHINKSLSVSLSGRYIYLSIYPVDIHVYTDRYAFICVCMSALRIFIGSGLVQF